MWRVAGSRDAARLHLQRQSLSLRHRVVHWAAAEVPTCTCERMLGRGWQAGSPCSLAEDAGQGLASGQPALTFCGLMSRIMMFLEWHCGM